MLSVIQSDLCVDVVCETHSHMNSDYCVCQARVSHHFHFDINPCILISQSYSTISSCFGMWIKSLISVLNRSTTFVDHGSSSPWWCLPSLLDQTIRFSHYIRSTGIRSELMSTWFQYHKLSYSLQTSNDVTGHQPCKLPSFARLDSIVCWRQTTQHTTRMKIQIYKPRIDRTERIYVECYTVWLVCWCCVWNTFAHDFRVLQLPLPNLTSVSFCIAISQIYSTFFPNGRHGYIVEWE
jgi:hypothetical protein